MGVYSMEYRERLPRVPKDEVTVVIPTLNEEEAIGLVIDELLQHGFRRENILVVDGHSTDNTVRIVEERGVHWIPQDGHGKADAILTAARYVDTPYMLVMDGDYTYDPGAIEQMLIAAYENPEVIGCRSDGRENIPLLHRLGNWILTQFFNVIFVTDLSDVCSGMYIVRTDIVKSLIGRAKGFSIEAEIAAAASNEGRIVEIPIRYRKRVGKRKLSSFKDGFNILLSIIVLSWWYNPIFFIFGMGSLLLIPSLFIATYVMIEYLFFGIKHFVWAIISVAGGVAGVLSLMLCLLTLYIRRMERRLIAEIRSIKRNRRRDGHDGGSVVN